MTKYKIINLIGAVALLISASCKNDEALFGNFLDKAPSPQMTEEQVFANFDYVEYYHNDIYNFLRSGLGTINGSWLDSGTDLAETSMAWGGVNTGFNVGNYFDGASSFELTDTWTLNYMGIRKVNKYLERVDNVPIKAGTDTATRLALIKQRKAEARFLRAFFYWEMVLRYGGVPLVTHTLSLDDDLYIQRSSYDDCVNYILTELDTVKKYLPLTYPDAERGRVTKGAAMTLKAKILMFNASPRLNSENKISKWVLAYQAVNEVINLGQYTLLDKYNEVFTERFNSELILWRNDAPGDWWRWESPVSFGGYGGICPTQELVDMFPMAENGLVPISGYNTDGTPILADTSLTGYNPDKPYVGRDPRFYITVLYNGAMWWKLPLETFDGGKDKPLGNLDATPTGYYGRKYKDDTKTHYLNGGTMYRNWIFMRYADVLLWAAEARNEILSAPDETVYGLVDQVRMRNGQGIKVKMPRNLSKDQMREFVRKERAVELAFEGHRWWDLRRWGIAKEYLGKPIHGVRINRILTQTTDSTGTAKTDTTYRYNYIKVEDRVFDDKMYLYPIPQSELVKYKNMQNNPGW